MKQVSWAEIQWDFFFPGFLGVTHFYGADDLVSLLVHQVLEFASDSDQNYWVESKSQVEKDRVCFLLQFCVFLVGYPSL